MNKSYVSADTILEIDTEPKPIYIPNAVAGYISDLIIKIANKKTSDAKNASDAKNSSDVDKKVVG
jgi:ribosomal protein S17E